MERYGSDGLVAVFSEGHPRIVFIVPVLHHNVLVEGDLVCGKHLLFAARVSVLHGAMPTLV